MDQEKIDRAYQWVSRITGALAICLGILWFANIRTRSMGEWVIVALLCVVFWRVTYYLGGLVLLGILGKSTSLINDKPFKNQISLRVFWPEILDVLTAKKHVKRGAIGLVVICCFLLSSSGVLRGSMIPIIRIVEIFLCLIFLWGMTRFYLWASIGALVYWGVKSLFLLSPTFNFFFFLFSIAGLTLLIHGIRGIIVYQKISRTPESKSEAMTPILPSGTNN